MRLLFSYSGDGWWPRISPTGTRVIFGGGGEPGVAPSLRIWTRDANLTSPPMPGRAGRFLADGTATFVRELDNYRAQRYTLDVNGGNHAIAIPTDDDPNLVGGNDFATGTGWASARVADMRLAVNNRVVPGVAARQVRARGEHLLVTEGNNEFFSIRPFSDPTQILWRSAVPPSAHFASLGARDIVAYGYESFFGVLNHPSIGEATGLPWRREGNALVVEAADGVLWGWSSGQRLDTGAGLVIGRRLNDPTNVVEVPFDGSGALDVLAAPDGFLVAGSSATGKLEVWLVRYEEAFGTPITLVRQATPAGTPLVGYAGYFFDFGRYGDYAGIPRNCTVIGRGLYAAGDGTLPTDVDDRIARAADSVGAIFLSAGDLDITLTHAIWDRVHGVWIHEPGDPASARAQTAAVKQAMQAMHLSPRPVIAVLTTEAALNPAYADVADWLAPEIYFKSPTSTWSEQLVVTGELIDLIQLHGCGVGGRPLILVPMCYDRQPSAWQTSALLLEPIQQACQAALAYARPGGVKGLWWFAYARPGGVKDHPLLLDWHRAQVQTTARPALPTPPTTPIPPQEPHVPNPDPLPGQAEFRDFTTFLHETCYQQELKRAGGLFESPDPANSRIFDPRAGDHVVVMDDAAFVWLGTYNQAFRDNLATPGGPHEAAKRIVREIIHNSDEAKRKRGETPGNPQ